MMEDRLAAIVFVVTLNAPMKGAKCKHLGTSHIDTHSCEPRRDIAYCYGDVNNYK